MISSPDRHDLVFPKGGWEDDETMEEAACREALEEAGVEGTLDSRELGAWEFRSKSSQSCCGMEGYCRGVMFALEVTKEYELWAEKSSHERRWLGVSGAFKLCRYEWMQEALQAFVSNLSKEEKGQDREDDVVEETDNPKSFLSEEYEGEAGETVLEEADQPTSYLSEEYEGQAREDVLEEAGHPTNYPSEEYEGQVREDVSGEADHPMSFLSEEYEGQAREDVVFEEADNPTSCLSEEYEVQAREDDVLEEAEHPMCYEDTVSEEADHPPSCLSEEYEEPAGEDVLEVADHPIRSPQMCYSFDTQRLDDPPMVALY
ncbi:hypothetical protein ACLOJK_023751 [Asimina triloba]